MAETKLFIFLHERQIPLCSSGTDIKIKQSFFYWAAGKYSPR